VEKRFTDVTYSIRTAPRARPIIAHIDRLRKFEGEGPEIWRTMKLSAAPPGRLTTPPECLTTPPGQIQTGSDSSAVTLTIDPGHSASTVVVELGSQADAPPADEDHAGTAPPASAERNPGASTRRTTDRAEVPPDTCGRGPSTAPLNSDKIQGRTPTGHTSYTAPLPSSAGAFDNNNDDIPPGQPARYNLRPAPARHLPARLKNIRAHELEVTTPFDNCERTVNAETRTVKTFNSF
jgi:hypothetical protein